MQDRYDIHDIAREVCEGMRPALREDLRSELRQMLAEALGTHHAEHHAFVDAWIGRMTSLERGFFGALGRLALTLLGAGALALVIWQMMRGGHR